VNGTHPLVVAALVVALAGLDLAGTVLAKEWTVHRAPWQLVASASAFTVLFVVVVIGLRYAEMTVITIGWIVVLQTGVVVVDAVRYDARMTGARVAVIAAIVVLQAVLVLTPGGSGDEDGLECCVSTGVAPDDGAAAVPAHPSAARAAS
jgi:hypothetical protein